MSTCHAVKIDWEKSKRKPLKLLSFPKCRWEISEGEEQKTFTLVLQSHFEPPEMKCYYRSEGDWRVRILADGWTAVTVDGARTAQMEHTVLITETGAEILTQWPSSSSSPVVASLWKPMDRLLSLSFVIIVMMDGHWRGDFVLVLRNSKYISNKLRIILFCS